MSALDQSDIAILDECIVYQGRKALRLYSYLGDVILQNALKKKALSLIKNLLNLLKKVFKIALELD
jgi:hypothetical protein